MARTRRTERAKNLDEQRRELPDAPGVYVFRDRAGDALYVGKANSIRKRVASHFAGKGGGRGSGMGGTAELIDRTDSIEFLVTENEPEALIAEQSFIKRYRPRFNIRLRDDKSYPYVGVSLDEDFPRVYFTRERHRANRAYFGPFSSAKRVRETLDLLGKLFQYRTCEGPEPGRRSGVPCLDYYIKRCQAPCVGYIDKDEYRRNIDRIVGFLSGRYKEIAGDLEEKMQEAAEARDFERAALFRDRLNAVRSMMERQQVAGGSLGSADLIGIAVEAGDANAQVFQVRDGVLAERQGFYLAGEDGESAEGDRDPAEVAETFLLQYYGAAPSVPGRVIVGPELQRSNRRARRGPLGPAGRAGRGQGRLTWRPAPPPGARREEREARPRPGQASPGAPPPTAGRDALLTAGGPRPGKGPGPDGGLRHLESWGDPHGRLDGGLRGWSAQEVRLPQVRRSGGISTGPTAMRRRVGEAAGGALMTSPRCRKCCRGG